MSLRYPPERYTDDLIVRVPPVLWLVMLFLVRHLILLGITFRHPDPVTKNQQDTNAAEILS